MLYFHLMEEGEEKERKKKKEKEEKNCLGEGGFPWDWTSVAGRVAGHSC
jgi:hypothetical protein